jgi:hypothetical protein
VRIADIAEALLGLFLQTPLDERLEARRRVGWQS